MAKSKHPVKKAVCIALCALLMYGAVSMLASAVVEDLVRTELSRSLEMRKSND